MSYLKLLIFLEALIFVSCQNQNYCNIESCFSSPHIGCNNDGDFSSNCDKFKGVTKIEMDILLRQLILDTHNILRNQIATGSLKNFPKAYSMPKVQWDNELAYLADLNSKQCQMKHDQCRNTPSIDFAGQNIGIGSSTAVLVNALFIKRTITSWWDENIYANVSDIKQYPTISSSGKSIGHFTVMANDDVTKIGCGMTTYQNTKNGKLWKSYLLACNYDSTNIYDSPVYRFGLTAKGCTQGVDLLYPGLCKINAKINPNKL